MSLTKTVQKCLHYIYPEMIIRYGNVLHKEDEGDFYIFLHCVIIVYDFHFCDVKKWKKVNKLFSYCCSIYCTSPLFYYCIMVKKCVLHYGANDLKWIVFENNVTMQKSCNSPKIGLISLCICFLLFLVWKWRDMFSLDVCGSFVWL